MKTQFSTFERFNVIDDLAVLVFTIYNLRVLITSFGNESLPEKYLYILIEDLNVLFFFCAEFFIFK